MDINQLEYAAKIVFKLCENHPELCPHDYSWEGTVTEDNIKHETYICRLCKHIEVRDRKV